MSEDTYNGWTNYETWRIQLEIVDDYVESLTEDGETATEWSQLDKLSVANMLEEYVDEVLTNFGTIESGLALDYARSFVREVNWYELAEHAQERIRESLVDSQ